MERKSKRQRLIPIRILTIALVLSAGLPFETPLTPAHAADDFSLEAYRGQIVWLDFWASWCTPCRRSFPWMNEIVERYADQGLVIVGVNVDRERNLADEFLRETPANFSIVYDPEGELAKQFEVLGMPSSYLIDQDGNVISSHIGFKRDQRENYEAAIREALGN
jgi:cytochrome c biogenesis protein CcmG/thiol:disulfide interchange protein DsbE